MPFLEGSVDLRSTRLTEVRGVQTGWIDYSYVVNPHYFKHEVQFAICKTQ